VTKVKNKEKKIYIYVVGDDFVYRELFGLFDHCGLACYGCVM